MNKRYKFYYVLVQIFFLAAILPAGAKARNLRVPVEYIHIQQAVDAAQDGDRVQVAEGIYLEQVKLKPGIILEGGWNRQFTQRNSEQWPVIIDAKGKKGWVVLAADRTVLDGFTIRNGTLVKTEVEEYGSGIYCLSVQDVIIRNNTLCQNEPSGIYCGNSTLTISGNRVVKNVKAGIRLDKGSTVLIESNIIERNKEAGISSKSKTLCQMEIRWNRIFQNNKGGIDCQNAVGKIYNNIIYENQDAGVRARIEPLEIINNTIVKNVLSGVVVDDPSKKIEIKNNIMAFNGESGITSAQQGYSYNLLFANAGRKGCDPACLPCVRAQHAGYEDEESFREIGHIIADPRFVDSNQHDYHLLPGSPAIDTGVNDPIYQDKHFPPSLGDDRNDLGAYGGPFTLPEERMKTNQPPMPQVESPSMIYRGDVVRLDATQSRDPDGDSLKYQWTLLLSPSGSKAKIFRADKPKTSFRADCEGKYQVNLQLFDRWGAKAESSISVNVQANHPPSAYAGEDLDEVSVGDTIQLFGDVSSDEDQDPLTYRWQIIACPEKSRIRLSDPSSALPTFSIDQPGGYIMQLIVNDGQRDSLPANILINTVHESPNKIRHVPAEYPTIQSAADAAQSGDTIVVQAGTYKENLYIDKSVNLEGIDWPVIDGGSPPGNADTVKIAYLANQAGRIEGFVITGGGAGPLGHGLSAWDSSPTICNNQFVGNPNNGLGIHGRRLLTEKAEVYGNIVYENKGGIGNGRGSCGHIHHNFVFHNRVFGIGCRGFSSPLIEYNHVFENYIGMGMREVSSPTVVGNYIYRNLSGIRFSPVSTVKVSVGDEIVIRNNLIFQNRENGIMVPFFNRSKVIITNNTIDANNKENRPRQGGGLILGWPWPGEFEAIVRDNIISNNKGVGVLNYMGVEDFQKPGVNLTLVHNNVWNNTENYQGCEPGKGSFSYNPLFVVGDQTPWECYFLSHTTAGQPQHSPCIDSGSGDVAEAKFLTGTTTRKDLQADINTVDLGFHYQPEECGRELPALVLEKLQ